MDDLILRSLEGPLSDVEQRRLAEWRAASPEHERRYHELSRLSRALEAAGPRRAATPPPTAASIIARSRGGVATRPFRWRALVAAALAVVAIGASYEVGAVRGEGQTFGAREILTGPNETSTVRLADGSVVRLGPASRLVVNEKQCREVWLDGTAFFAIAKQAGVPFVVRSGVGTATVLGTRFEMKTGGDQLRVVVVEGRVEVENAAGQVEVAGGEMSYADKASPPAVSQVADPSRLLGWVGRVLLFNDTRLVIAAREIESRYPVKIVLADSALGEHLVSGTFPDQPIDQLMATICRVIDARCSLAADTVWIASGQSQDQGLTRRKPL